MTSDWVRKRPVWGLNRQGNCRCPPPPPRAGEPWGSPRALLAEIERGTERASQTNPSEACLIVAEFPVGVTLKKHPQEESWDVRKTFSGSICWGELRLCAQGPAQILCRWNTVTPLLLRLKDRPVQHIAVPDSNAHYCCDARSEDLCCWRVNNNELVCKILLLFLPSFSIPTLRHFIKRQAWHDLRLRFVISHSFVAGQLYSMLPGEGEKKRKTISYRCITILGVDTMAEKRHVCSVEVVSRQEEVCCGGKAPTVLEDPSVDATLDQR